MVNYESLTYKKLKEQSEQLNLEIETLLSEQKEFTIELKILEKAFYNTNSSSDRDFIRSENNKIKNKLEKIESSLPKFQSKLAEVTRRLDLLESATEAFEKENQ